MSTKDNFERDRERKRQEAMTGDQRALESALGAIQALKRDLDALKAWQSGFVVRGKTVEGGDGDNQWVVNAAAAGVVGGFDPNSLKIYGVDGTTVLRDGIEPSIVINNTVTVSSALYVTEFCVDSVTSYALIFRSVFSSNPDMS